MTEYRQISDLTEDEIDNKLFEIANNDPRRVYTEYMDSGRCQYMHGDEPGCIFGHALLGLGVDPDEMREWDSYFNNGISDRLIGVASDSALARWGSLQSEQDKGITWENAVQRAYTGGA